MNDAMIMELKRAQHRVQMLQQEFVSLTKTLNTLEQSCIELIKERNEAMEEIAFLQCEKLETKEVAECG